MKSAKFEWSNDFFHSLLKPPLPGEIAQVLRSVGCVAASATILAESFLRELVIAPCQGAVQGGSAGPTRGRGGRLTAGEAGAYVNATNI